MLPRCPGALLGFLLERMEGVDNTRELNGIDGPVCVAIVVFDDFENPSSTESLQGFGDDVFLSSLSEVKGKSNLPTH